jgi:hypothetical protein
LVRPPLRGLCLPIIPANRSPCTISRKAFCRGAGGRPRFLTRRSARHVCRRSLSLPVVSCQAVAGLTSGSTPPEGYLLIEAAHVCRGINSQDSRAICGSDVARQEAVALAPGQNLLPCAPGDPLERPHTDCTTLSRFRSQRMTQRRERSIHRLACSGLTLVPMPPPVCPRTHASAQADPCRRYTELHRRNHYGYR